MTAGAVRPQARPVIAVESADQPDVIALLQASDAYHAELYPPESNYLLDVASLTRPEVTFLVARVDARVVGIGALVEQDGEWAEIKRMFVDPLARGRGLGHAILAALEGEARARRLAWIRLETGVKQPETLALYRAAGFIATGPFGAYRPDPHCVFMAKRLGD